MLTCKKCNISLAGSPDSCPLCQGDLIGEPSLNDNVFPSIPMNYSYNSLLKKVSAGVIILSIVCFAINATFPETGAWSLVVIAAMASLWLSFYFVMKNKKKIAKNVFFQVLILVLLSHFWDSYTGYHQWSITYVIPVIITCAIIIVYSIAKIRKMNPGDYALYLLILCIFGIIGFRYVTSHDFIIIIPMAICLVISIAAIVLILMFEYKSIWSEIRRRLHL